MNPLSLPRSSSSAITRPDGLILPGRSRQEQRNDRFRRHRAGTGQLTRLAFRRDLAVLPACVFWISALLGITARDIKALYPTAAMRLAVATVGGENPALRFLLGRLNGRTARAGRLGRARAVIAGWGLAFAGVAAVGAQLAVTARGARGIAIAALGAAFALRAVGDGGPAWLAGYVFIFAACGAAATGTGPILGASAQLRRYLLREGNQADLIHAFLSALMLLGAALVRLPAVLVLTAVAVVLFGLLPWESTALAWSAAGLAGVVAIFGPPLQWPAWPACAAAISAISALPGWPSHPATDDLAGRAASVRASCGPQSVNMIRQEAP